MVVKVRTAITIAGATPSWHTTELSGAERERQAQTREAMVFAAPLSETKKDCDKFLKQLNMTNDRKYAWYFEAPIDLVALPTYASVIARPLSRSQVIEGLANGKYGTMGELVEEMRLVYANAIVFNASGDREGAPKSTRDCLVAARYMQVGDWLIGLLVCWFVGWLIDSVRKSCMHTFYCIASHFP